MHTISASALLKAGTAHGIRVAAEGFADRAYQPDGSLASRQHPGAVITDARTVIARALRMVKERTVVAVDGASIPLAIDTLCIHGDTPGAGELAAALRAGLEAAGIRIAAPLRT